MLKMAEKIKRTTTLTKKLIGLEKNSILVERYGTADVPNRLVSTIAIAQTTARPKTA